MIHDEDVRDLIVQWRSKYPGRESLLLDYVELAGASTDAPLAFHIFAMLPVMATLLPANVQAMAGFGSVCPNLWTLIVGDSGARKSVSLNMAADMLTAIGRPDLVGVEPNSVEGMITSLQRAPTQLLTYSEFGAFLSATFEGKGQRRLGPLRERMTDAYDGKPIRLGYSNDENNKQVDTHRMSLSGACSEGYLNRYTLIEDWTGGFMGRFLMVRARVWDEKPLVTRRDPRWMHVENRMRLMSAEDCSQPSTTLLTRKAEDTLNAFTPSERLRVAAMNVGRKAYLSSTLNRLDIAAIRLAMVLTWDSGAMRSNPKRWRISMAEMDLALSIMRMHVNSFAGIVDILAGNKVEQTMGAIRLLLELGPCALSTLIREVEPRQTAQQIKQILKTMEEAEEVVSNLEGDLWALAGPGVDLDEDDDDDEE